MVLWGATLVILTKRRGRPFEKDQSHEVGSWTCCTPRIKAKNAVCFFILFPFFSYIFLFVATHIFQFLFSMFINVSSQRAGFYYGISIHRCHDAFSFVPRLHCPQCAFSPTGFPLPSTPNSALSLPIFITPSASHLKFPFSASIISFLISSYHTRAHAHTHMNTLDVCSWKLSEHSSNSRY